jgi:hypothetical protein
MLLQRSGHTEPKKKSPATAPAGKVVVAAVVTVVVVVTVIVVTIIVTAVVVLAMCGDLFSFNLGLLCVAASLPDFPPPPYLGRKKHSGRRLEQKGKKIK